jgi:hypothetical protein
MSYATLSIDDGLLVRGSSERRVLRPPIARFITRIRGSSLEMEDQSVCPYTLGQCIYGIGRSRKRTVSHPRCRLSDSKLECMWVIESCHFSQLVCRAQVLVHIPSEAVV